MTAGFTYCMFFGKLVAPCVVRLGNPGKFEQPRVCDGEMSVYIGAPIACPDKQGVDWVDGRTHIENYPLSSKGNK
jgi:hypothetical protein